MASWRLKNPGQLVDGWAFNGTADSFFGRYPGTLVNVPTWVAGPRGRQCIELDGATQHVTLGDVTEMDSANALTVCFWMAQDVLDTQDYIFRKYLDANNYVMIFTNAADGTMRFYICNGSVSHGRFDYSTVISAGNWHHVAMVFDGSGAANVSRLVVYVDGAPVTLAFAFTIPATTADLGGQETYIGLTNQTFDGKLYDFRIYSAPLSRDEIISVIHTPVPVLA